MAVISRPGKEGNATTYQGKVAAGYTNILAQEVDADIDAIYAAWNAGVDTVNIKDGSVTASKLASGAITPPALGVGVIHTANLADGAVTTPKIAPANVTGAQIAGQTITAANIADNTLTTGQIGYETIQGSNIALQTIAANNIANNTLTTGQIAFETIQSSNLALGASLRTYGENALSGSAIITGSQQVLGLTLPTLTGGIVNVPVLIMFHLGGEFSILDSFSSTLMISAGFNGATILTRNIVAQGTANMVNATLPWTMAFSAIAFGAADPNYVQVYLQRTAGGMQWNVNVGQLFVVALA